MKRPRMMAGALVLVGAMFAVMPVLAAPTLEAARLVQAPDGVLFVIHEGVRYRVTPQQMTFGELGAIPEGGPLAVGQIGAGAPPVAAAPAGQPRIVQPSAEMGLSRERAIPRGVTCSCTIDRSGLISQFDITVVEVMRDAYSLLQQANRFNKPPSEGNEIIGVYLDIKYVRGPEDQAYTVLPSDFRTASLAQRIHDPLVPLNPVEPIEADIRPGATVRGWVFFEVPRNAPTTLIWQFSFLGERGVWFAL